MQSSADVVEIALFSLIAATWFVFGIIFLLHKKPGKAAEHARDPKSLSGMVLQCIAYFLVWYPARAEWSPIAPMPKWAEMIVAVIALVIMALSIWILWRAIVALGKQWAYVARILQGHKLITEGPYGIVRNPIYAGMLGMIISTGLAVARWQTFIAAILLYLAGTWIRVRREERLLRQAFGAEFDSYRRRVPALIPWVI